MDNNLCLATKLENLDIDLSVCWLMDVFLLTVNSKGRCYPTLKGPLDQPQFWLQFAFLSHSNEWLVLNLMYSKLFRSYFELFPVIKSYFNWSVNVKWQSYDYPKSCDPLNDFSADGRFHKMSRWRSLKTLDTLRYGDHLDRCT